MTDTTKRIPRSECIQGRCADLTTGCWGECSIRAAFPLNNVACGDPVAQPRAREQADERARRELENTEFAEWWEREQACPEHNLITENAAHAAWQERGRRATITQQAAPEAPKCDYHMPDGRLCPKCGNVHGSLATTASASIGDDPQFRIVLENWSGAAHSCDERTRTIYAKQAYNALVAHIDSREAAPQAAGEAANEMRIALTVQISELIDVAERYARRAHKQGDTEERDYVQGAIDYARKVAEPYNYNGPLRTAHPGEAPAGEKGQA